MTYPASFAFFEAYSGKDTSMPGQLVHLANAIKGLRVFDAGGSEMSFPATHPGWLGCSYGGDESITTADVILVLDCDVPWIPTRCKPKDSALVLHIDVDPLKENMPVFYINAQHRYRADSFTAIEQINSHIASNRDFQTILAGQRFVDRWDRLKESYKQRLQRIESDAMPNPGGDFGTPFLIREVRKAVPNDSIFVIEAITNTQIVAEQIQAEIPGSWFHSGGGRLGWSGGAVLGVKLATDTLGSKKFVCQIIARRYNIPILTIVLNNKGWNAPRNFLLLVRPDGPASKVSTEDLNISFATTPDYAGIARAAGHGEIGAFRASTAVELPNKLAKVVGCVLRGTSAVFDAQLHGSEGKYTEIDTQAATGRSKI